MCLDHQYIDGARLMWFSWCLVVSNEVGKKKERTNFVNLICSGSLDKIMFTFEKRIFNLIALSIKVKSPILSH